MLEQFQAAEFSSVVRVSFSCGLCVFPHSPDPPMVDHGGGGEHTYIYIYIRLKKCQIGLYILLDSDTPPYEMRRCPRYEQDGLLVRKPCFLPRGSGRLALELSEVFGFTVDCNGLGKKSAASAGIKQQLHRVCLQYLKPT